jgi:methionyl aminopeptidase
MVHLKTKEEIEQLRASNLLVSRTIAEVAKFIRPGVTTLDLDRIAEEFIRDSGAIPGFLGYSGYPATLCTSVNQQVVHGIPSSYALKEGDIISVDCGALYNGYYGDSAYTFAVGEIGEPVKDLLRSTKESLFLALKEAVAGKRVGDISHTVQYYCEKRGFSIVRELVGHGIGKSLHEQPEVPNYGKRGQGMRLQKGLVICIEPMVNMGKKDIVHSQDGWTVSTADRLPSAHYELCVAVGDDGPDVLSTFGFIEEAYSNII